MDKKKYLYTKSSLNIDVKSKKKQNKTKPFTVQKDVSSPSR